MSANIDSMMYVGGVPWHGLGIKYDAPPKTSEEIIKGTQLDWTVSAHVMSSDIRKEESYHGIYRDDTQHLFSIVHSKYPKLVQNSDTFLALEHQLGVCLDVSTAASLGKGETVFGCFELKTDDKVLDDEVKTYFVVLNDHTRADGKVTVFNTPIRVVCENTLSAALSSAHHKLRVPITEDASMNMQIVDKILSMHQEGISVLNKKADLWATRKLTRENMEKILDVLFPIPEENIERPTATLKAEMKRNTFLESCMQADNLDNYRGTVYQVFNALTDYTQHYVSNPDKALDLKYRMNTLPGIGADSPATMVSKFIQMQEKMFRAA